MKILKISLLLAMTVSITTIYPMQEVQQFYTSAAGGIPINGIKEWKDWTGLYFPHKNVAILRHTITGETKMIPFINISYQKNPSIKAFATTLANPNTDNQNLFSSELTLFNPYLPQPILYGKEINLKC